MSTTLIGLASLLPDDMRMMCSCAGLFFAQVIEYRAGEHLYRVKVAALPGYFSRRYHVDEILLSREECAQLLGWDRRLASMETCDVREEVEAHVKEQILAKVSVATDTTDTVQSESVPQRGQETASNAIPASSPHPVVVNVDAADQQPAADTSHKPRKRIDLESVNFETISIDLPLELLKEAFFEPNGNNRAFTHMKYQAYDMRPGYRRRCTVILRTALAYLKQEIRATESYQRRRALREQKRAIYSVFEQAKQVPPQIELELHYQRGKHGQALCHVQLAVPVIGKQRQRERLAA
jgi:hypothetical protein